MISSWASVCEPLARQKLWIALHFIWVFGCGISWGSIRKPSIIVSWMKHMKIYEYLFSFDYAFRARVLAVHGCQKQTQKKIPFNSARMPKQYRFATNCSVAGRIFRKHPGWLDRCWMHCPGDGLKRWEEFQLQFGCICRQQAHHSQSPFIVHPAAITKQFNEKCKWFSLIELPLERWNVPQSQQFASQMMLNRDKPATLALSSNNKTTMLFKVVRLQQRFDSQCRTRHPIRVHSFTACKQIRKFISFARNESNSLGLFLSSNVSQTKLWQSFAQK